MFFSSTTLRVVPPGEHDSESRATVLNPKTPCDLLKRLFGIISRHPLSRPGGLSWQNSAGFLHRFLLRGAACQGSKVTSTRATSIATL